MTISHVKSALFSQIHDIVDLTHNVPVFPKRLTIDHIVLCDVEAVWSSLYAGIQAAISDTGVLYLSLSQDSARVLGQLVDKAASEFFGNLSCLDAFHFIHC